MALLRLTVNSVEILEWSMDELMVEGGDRFELDAVLIVKWELYLGALVCHSPKLSSYSPINRLVKNRTVRAETRVNPRESSLDK